MFFSKSGLSLLFKFLQHRNYSGIHIKTGKVSLTGSRTGVFLQKNCRTFTYNGLFVHKSLILYLSLHWNCVHDSALKWLAGLPVWQVHVVDGSLSGCGSIEFSVC